MEDLDTAAAYVARDSSVYAAGLVRRVFETAASLQEFAELGTIVEELGDGAIRERYVSGYRVIYAIRNDVVYLLGVIHAARDFSTAWNERPRPR